MESSGHEGSEKGAPMEMPTPWQLYREGRLIRSAGRTLLSDAFSHYMALIDGIGPTEIANAFDSAGNADDRDLLEREIHFLAKIFVEGRIRTFARLAGGGDPIELPASAWELDDAVPRFATSSLNVDEPHNSSAAATHWIFVDTHQWDAAMDGLRDSRLPSPNEWDSAEVEPGEPPAIAVVHSDSELGPKGDGATHSALDPWRNEILSIEAVISATGLKRSTIYAKVAAGSFPRQIAIHGTRKGWRRGHVQDWLDSLAP